MPINFWDSPFGWKIVCNQGSGVQVGWQGYCGSSGGHFGVQVGIGVSVGGGGVLVTVGLLVDVEIGVLVPVGGIGGLVGSGV